MLYSPERRFLFLHAPKTAGTPIEIALSRVLSNPSDVITPFGLADELLSLSRDGHGLQNGFKKPGLDLRTFRNLRECAGIVFSSCLAPEGQLSSDLAGQLLRSGVAPKTWRSPVTPPSIS